jgi:hypothetical protein
MAEPQNGSSPLRLPAERHASPSSEKDHHATTATTLLPTPCRRCQGAWSRSIANIEQLATSRRSVLSASPAGAPITDVGRVVAGMGGWM